jgi:hypothetical protein
MTIWNSIGKFGKKAFKSVKKFGKNVIHEIPRVIQFARKKIAPIVSKVAKIQGDIAGTLAVPLGVATGQPELTAGLEAISAGSKVAGKLADKITIEKKKPHQKAKPQNPMENIQTQSVQPVQPSLNPFIRGGGGRGIRHGGVMSN